MEKETVKELGIIRYKISATYLILKIPFLEFVNLSALLSEILKIPLKQYKNTII